MLYHLTEKNIRIYPDTNALDAAVPRHNVSARDRPSRDAAKPKSSDAGKASAARIEAWTPTHLFLPSQRLFFRPRRRSYSAMTSGDLSSNKTGPEQSCRGVRIASSMPPHCVTGTRTQLVRTPTIHMRSLSVAPSKSPHHPCLWLPYPLYRKMTFKCLYKLCVRSMTATKLVLLSWYPPMDNPMTVTIIQRVTSPQLIRPPQIVYCGSCTLRNERIAASLQFETFSKVKERGPKCWIVHTVCKNVFVPFRVPQDVRSVISNLRTVRDSVFEREKSWHSDPQLKESSELRGGSAVQPSASSERLASYHAAFPNN